MRMRISNKRAIAACTVMVTGIFVWTLRAGDLNPPTAPSAGGTMKTLEEVEPRVPVQSLTGDASNQYIINRAGSYYLTDNLTGISGKNGIVIQADNVTVDLKGFRLSGSKLSSGSAIVIASGVSETTICNGTITGWDGDGINGEDTGFTVIDNVQLYDLTGGGIFLGGEFRIQGCSVRQCANGFELGTGVLTRCGSADNSGFGIACGTGCVITECTANRNGSDGFQTGPNGSMVNCTARSNSGHGYNLGLNSQVSECTAADNLSYGFRLQKGSCLVKSTSRGNTGHGIYAESNSDVIACTVSGNSDRGITAVDGCNIRDCTSSENSTDGIGVNSACTISGCVVRKNTLDGIRCFSNCIITDNNCQDNGLDSGNGAGIHAFNNNSRIEKNRCSGADRGLHIGGTGNRVNNNTVLQNTDNYDIAADNHLQILLCEIPETIDWPSVVTLAGSLKGVANEHGIEVRAKDVTIDLAGYSLVGVADSDMGIFIDDYYDNITIRNGAIRGFDSGIYVYSFSDGIKISHVQFLSNKQNGIILLGSDNQVKDYTILDNGYYNTTYVWGINIGQNSIVTGNTIRSNGTSSSSDIFGISAGASCLIVGNTVSYNGSSVAGTVYGIRTFENCTISGNTVNGNGGYGEDDVYGIQTDTGCTVIGNTCNGNGFAAGGSVYGIYLEGNCFADQNTAYDNNGTNLYAPASCTLGTNHAP